MGRDHPDGTLKTIVVNVITETPSGVADPAPIPTPTTQTDNSQVAPLTTSSASKQTVVTRTVSSNKIGRLEDIEIDCDNWPIARLSVSIGGVYLFEDKQFQNPLSLYFYARRLAPATVVMVQVLSDGTTSITAWGAIIMGEEG